jgi:hypothetical protein
MPSARRTKRDSARPTGHRKRGPAGGSQLAVKGEILYKIATLMGNSPAICQRHYAALIPEAMHDTVEFPTETPTNDGGADTKAMLQEVLRQLNALKGQDSARPTLKLVTADDAD